MLYQKNINICFCFLQPIVVAVFLSSLIAKPCYSQGNSNYFFRRITQEDGLLHNNVYDIVQDKRGFIWMATDNGLQRYDGYRFLNIRDALNNMQAAYNTPSLAVDTAGNRLRIYQSPNVETLNLLNQQIAFYSSNKLLDSLSSQCEVYKDQHGLSYLLSSHIVFRFGSANNRYETLSQSATPLEKGLSSNYIIDSVNGQMWMGSNTTGLTLFDAKTKGVYSASYNPIHNAVLEACRKQFGDTAVAIRRVMMDSHHNLWIATWGRMFYQYQSASGKLLSYSLSSLVYNENNKDNPAPQTVSCFYEDNHHTIWISAENAGLLAYHPSANSFESISASNSGEQSNPFNYNIFCIYQDREENIWLGTDKGIALFNPYRQYFQAVHHEENQPSLPKSEIECYTQTKDGDMLAGTWGGGITVFDSNWNFKRNIRFFNTPSEYNLVWNFTQNDDETIWAGCQHGYIHIYNPDDGSVRTLHPPEMNNSTIRCAAKDKQGNIWLGLHNGKITQWNQQQQRFYAYNDSDDTQQNYAPVTFIFFDKQQRCWVGTEGEGLKQFDTQKRQYMAVYKSSDDASHAMASNLIQGIEQLNDITLVLATRHGGLVLFSSRLQSFIRFTPASDTRFSSCYAVKKDAAGDLWFTTDYGLYKWQEEDGKFMRYQVASGMLNSAFKSTSFYPLQNGRWATSTAMEIITFLPRRNRTVEPEAKIEITGVSVFDAPVPVDSVLAMHQPLYLSYKQNFLTIEFAKLSFITLHHTDYYCRLQGVDKDWVYGDNQPFATYTNLAPGTYTFEVKGEDDTGETASTSLQIIIEPPFWKTDWFLLLAGFCIGSVVYLFVRWRIKSVRAAESEKRNAQEARIETLSLKEKLASAKLQALKSQMNPHFIFNCLNSIDNLIQTGEKEKATTYLAKFAKLIRSILETSGSNTVPCWKDMEAMKMYLEMEELRCDNQFVYHINVSNEIMNGDYKVPPLVIQPFVENAIHHGLLNKREKDKELKIDVSVQNNYIHYIIRDNGVGRAKAEEYKQLNKPSHLSMGLQITTDRIHLFNQNGNGAVVITDLFDTQHQPAGTRIEVSIMNQS